jgi:hypothetical protein
MHSYHSLLFQTSSLLNQPIVTGDQVIATRCLGDSQVQCISTSNLICLGQVPSQLPDGLIRCDGGLAAPQQVLYELPARR